MTKIKRNKGHLIHEWIKDHNEELLLDFEVIHRNVCEIY